MATAPRPPAARPARLRPFRRAEPPPQCSGDARKRRGPIRQTRAPSSRAMSPYGSYVISREHITASAVTDRARYKTGSPAQVRQWANNSIRRGLHRSGTGQSLTALVCNKNEAFRQPGGWGAAHFGSPAISGTANIKDIWRRFDAFMRKACVLKYI